MFAPAIDEVDRRLSTIIIQHDSFVSDLYATCRHCNLRSDVSALVVQPDELTDDCIYGHRFDHIHGRK